MCSMKVIPRALADSVTKLGMSSLIAGKCTTETIELHRPSIRGAFRNAFFKTSGKRLIQSFSCVVTTGVPTVHSQSAAPVQARPAAQS